MSAGKTGETKSYRDLAGERIRAAEAARKQREERFPDVAAVYDGFYFSFESTDKRSGAFLAGGEGVVGTELSLKVTEAGAVQIIARDGAVIAALEDEPAQRLQTHHANGWTIRAVLALTMYHNDENRFKTEAACFCYSSTLDEMSKHALDTFIGNITYRINKGAHPGLSLNQEQFMKVIESKGSWYLTKNAPLPPREKGMIYYKRRRTWSEYLIASASRGNRGCKIVAILFWVVLAAAIVFAIWWFFFR